MAIVKIKTKYGDYAYDSVARWDPDLKQSRPIRTYLGRIGPDGEIIPTSGKRGRKPKLQAEKSAQTTPTDIQDNNAKLSELSSEIERLKTENVNLKVKIDELTKRAQKAERMINNFLNTLRLLIRNAEKQQN